MALPIDFITRTRALLGEEFDRLEAALSADVPVSIRINPMKGTPAPKAGAPVAWCESGFYLPERLSFTFDPLFHAGAYYVQEASSMFLEQAIKAYVKEPVRCLDLCAAPGGKSTHLASLLPDGSLLVSNEVIRSRVMYWPRISLNGATRTRSLSIMTRRRSERHCLICST